MTTVYTLRDFVYNMFIYRIRIYNMIYARFCRFSFFVEKLLFQMLITALIRRRPRSLTYSSALRITEIRMCVYI